MRRNAVGGRALFSTADCTAWDLRKSRFGAVPRPPFVRRLVGLSCPFGRLLSSTMGARGVRTSDVRRMLRCGQPLSASGSCARGRSLFSPPFATQTAWHTCTARGPLSRACRWPRKTCCPTCAASASLVVSALLEISPGDKLALELTTDWTDPRRLLWLGAVRACRQGDLAGAQAVQHLRGRSGADALGGWSFQVLIFAHGH